MCIDAGIIFNPVGVVDLPPATNFSTMAFYTGLAAYNPAAVRQGRLDIMQSYLSAISVIPYNL
jgi:hypothetical protein